MNKTEFCVSLSGLTVRVACDSKAVKNFCADYLTDAETDADITVTVSESEIEQEMSLYSSPHSRAYCENICLYRAIAERLPELERFVFHGAAVEVYGEGYVFAAPSGVGKSTHVGLWRECFGDLVRIINGDKPIISVSEEVLVHGTPWSGKEGWNCNASAPLRAICFIERSETNEIKKLRSTECFDLLMKQIYVPKNGDSMLKTLELVDTLSKKVDFYLLKCNTTKEAARVAFEAMTKRE